MSTEAEKKPENIENGQKDDISPNKGPNRRGGFGNRGGRMSMSGGPPGGRRPDKDDGGPPNRMNNQMQGGRGRGRGGFRGGRGGGGGGPPGDRNNDGGSFFNERLLMTIGGSTTDLPVPAEKEEEKKFNNKTRLYVGNLHPETSQEEFASLFTKYGETSEIYINKEKNFAFIRLDYRSSAEKAKRELDGLAFKQRNIRVRFAPLGSTIKVKNLTPYVTNELLELGFSIFGEIERAHVAVDERGNSLKEGVVEFARKTSATNAVRHCTEGCFFLTNALRPVIVELFSEVEDTEGFREKAIVKKTQEYYEARSVGPRFAAKGSFEFEFGTRWKQIHELAKQEEEALKRKLRLEEEKLEAQMQFAKYEHETEMLREELRKREMDRERQKREWEMKERQAEEQRATDEESVRRHQEELSRRMVSSDDDLRRRQQENNLFVQAQQLSSLLDKQEDGRGNFKGDDSSNPEILRHHYEENFQRGRGSSSDAGFGDRGYSRPGDRGGFDDGGRIEEVASRRPQGAGGSRWGHQERRGGPPDDFQNKRRRF